MMPVRWLTNGGVAQDRDVLGARGVPEAGGAAAAKDFNNKFGPADHTAAESAGTVRVSWLDDGPQDSPLLRL
jgi:hypothetical protein